MSLRAVAAAVGALVLMGVVLMFVPLLISITGAEPRAVQLGWAVGCLTGLVAGWAIYRVGRPADERDLGPREGYAIVTLGWLACSMVGAVPFVLGANLSLLDAWFETISGFTTTGSSILPHPEALAPSLLLWRSLTQWVGGLGIVVLSVAFLPALGVKGASLVRAEFSEHERRLQPRIADTARRLWGLYLGLTMLQIVLMVLGGVSGFDAVCHTFATISGGGFSTHSDSVAAFHSPYIEWVVTIFMIVGGVNFALMYGALARGRIRALLRDPELRFYLGTFGVATAAVATGLWLNAGVPGSIPAVVRAAAFNTASMLTTTGFATTDFALWPPLCHLALVAVMFIGGCAGSTSGSIKSIRVSIACRIAWREIRLLLRPRQVIPLLVGDHIVDRERASATTAFIVLYMACFLIGTTIVAATGLDLLTAGTASAACLGNIGPGLGAAGPATNFGALAPVAKATLGMLMLLGRLEIYSVILLLAPKMWR